MFFSDYLCRRSTCISARWHCQPATPEERDLLANVTLRTQMECRSSHNEEYTSCEPERQLTCKVCRYMYCIHKTLLSFLIFMTASVRVSLEKCNWAFLVSLFSNRLWANRFQWKSRLNVARDASAKRDMVSGNTICFIFNLKKNSNGERVGSEIFLVCDL